MVTIDDFIEIPFTDEIIKISRWIAERRVLYEYPGHAPDSERDENHIINIQKGTIAELTTFDYFHKILEREFGALDPEARWKVVQDKLCLQNQIGGFDKGSDLIINKKTVDIKIYNTRVTKQRMMGLNLFIAIRDMEVMPPADFYIQSFFTQTPNNVVVLAGYHEGLPVPTKYNNIPTPAHFCPVPDLKPISELVELLLDP